MQRFRAAVLLRCCGRRITTTATRTGHSPPPPPPFTGNPYKYIGTLGELRPSLRDPPPPVPVKSPPSNPNPWTALAKAEGMYTVPPAVPPPPSNVGPLKLCVCISIVRLETGKKGQSMWGYVDMAGVLAYSIRRQKVSTREGGKSGISGMVL